MLELGDIATPVASLAIGIALGFFYFGGLWWTIARLPRSRRPLPLFFGSLAVRLAVLLSSFYALLAYAGWVQFAVAFFFFFVMRLAIVSILGRSELAPLEQKEAR